MRIEHQYKLLCNTILYYGEAKSSRAGMVRSLFGKQIGADLEQEFPMLTGKKIYFEKARAEWMWMYQGKTDIRYLNDHGIKWWNPYANEEGDVGKVYGHQIRNFNDKIDQWTLCKEEIENNSRRALITFWNPVDEPWQSLPPCYSNFNFVRMGDKLNMVMNIRSSDVAVGLPYDMIIGAMALHEMAVQTGLKPKYISYSLADAHIYANNAVPLEEYLAAPMYKTPEYNPEFQTLGDYNSGPYIKMKMNV